MKIGKYYETVFFYKNQTGFADFIVAFIAHFRVKNLNDRILFFGILTAGQFFYRKRFAANRVELLIMIRRLVNVPLSPLGSFVRLGSSCLRLCVDSL